VILQRSGEHRVRSVCQLGHSRCGDQQLIEARAFLVDDLRRTAELAMKVPRTRPDIEQALSEFDRRLPAVQTMRDVGEHIDDYALDQGRNPGISRRALQVGSWDGTTLSWLGESLNADEALASAEALAAAVRRARSLARQGA
jgi:hypothetical protein